jgi:hypothetical protein
MTVDHEPSRRDDCQLVTWQHDPVQKIAAVGLSWHARCSTNFCFGGRPSLVAPAINPQLSAGAPSIKQQLARRKVEETMVTEGNESVVAVFGSRVEAQEAIAELEKHGWDERHASLITRDEDVDADSAQRMRQGDRMESTAAAGAAAGATIGLLAGATLLVIPGLGPLVAAGAVASGLTGGIVGGLVGAMSGWGVAPTHARRYEGDLVAGKTLVVLIDDPARLAEGRAVLLATPAERVTMHAETADSTVDK